MVVIFQDRYILRNAAGLYWLVDTKQPGLPYKPPLRLSKAGADILYMLEKGYSKSDIISSMSKEYGIDEDIISKDVELFFEDLGKYI